MRLFCLFITWVLTLSDAMRTRIHSIVKPKSPGFDLQRTCLHITEQHV